MNKIIGVCSGVKLLVYLNSYLLPLLRPSLSFYSSRVAGFNGMPPMLRDIEIITGKLSVGVIFREMAASVHSPG